MLESEDMLEFEDKFEYEEWRADIIQYFAKQIDIWTKYFVKGKIEEIEIFLTKDANYYIGMKLLENGIWYELCFPNYLWQAKYLENVSYEIKDDVKDSCYLDQLWFYFCDEASEEEKDSMINDIVAGLKARYNCNVTAINQSIQLSLQDE